MTGSRVFRATVTAEVIVVVRPEVTSFDIKPGLLTGKGPGDAHIHIDFDGIVRDTLDEGDGGFYADLTPGETTVGPIEELTP